MRRGIWNEEGRKVYRNKMMWIELEQGEARKEGKKMERRIKKVIEEVEKEVGGWRKKKRWDGEHRNKEEIRRELR